MPTSANIDRPVAIERPLVASLLRWMGSKRRSADQVARLLPNLESRRYVEPFFGGGSVFFATRPQRAVISDSNPDLMNAWTQVRDRHAELYREINSLGPPLTHYYVARDEFKIATDAVRRAALFIYLNRYCFNGVYRTNRRGEFNVPMGKRTGEMPALLTFEMCSRLLAGVTIECGDFAGSIRHVDAGSVVYLDPPFPTLRPTFGEYGYSTFPDVTMERLGDYVAGVIDRQACAVLSLPVSFAANFPHPAHSLAVHYSVGGRTRDRGTADEMAIIVNSEGAKR